VREKGKVKDTIGFKDRKKNKERNDYKADKKEGMEKR
jgi:hypothetical protein